MMPLSPENGSNRSGLLANLELIRGIAACFVVVLHLSEPFNPIYLPVSYFAVDIFFIMSGFVVSRSYEHRLREGSLSRPDFLLLRWIRLYPLILLGVLLGTLSAWINGGRPALSTIVLNLFVLPAFGAERLYLDGPMWSLFFEMFATLCFAAGLYRTRTGHIAILIIVSFVLTLCGALMTKHNVFSLGHDQRRFIFGFPRVLLGYLWGQLLSRLSIKHIVRISTPLSLLVVTLCLLPLSLPVFGKASQILLGSFCLLVLFPACVAWAGRFNPAPSLFSIFRIIGVISYPLYIIHTPVYEMMGSNIMRLASPPICGWVLLTLLAGLSYGLDTIYDKPVRKFLTRCAGWRETMRQVASTKDRTRLRQQGS